MGRQAVKQKVRLRPRRGPGGLKYWGPPWWSCQPKSEALAFTWPSWGLQGLPRLLHWQSTGCKLSSSRGLSRTPCEDQGPAGPKDTFRFQPWG